MAQVRMGSPNEHCSTGGRGCHRPSAGYHRIDHVAAEQPETSYALALEEARRGFDQLAADVTMVRDRTVSTLGMGGLAASFVGGLAIRGGSDVSGWTWLAVTAFTTLAVLSVIVLWPRRFHVSQDPGKLVAWAEENGASAADMERDLALWLGKKYDENRPKVDWLGVIYTAAMVAFLIEIAALVLDLMSR
jgi:hypothetical protein